MARRAPSEPATGVVIGVAVGGVEARVAAELVVPQLVVDRRAECIAPGLVGGTVGPESLGDPREVPIRRGRAGR